MVIPLSGVFGGHLSPLRALRLFAASFACLVATDEGGNTNRR
jgi:hypothetical protein